MVLGEFGDEALGKDDLSPTCKSAGPSGGGAPRAVAKSRSCVTSIAAAPECPTGRAGKTIRLPGLQQHRQILICPEAAMNSKRAASRDP
jgi:hypothetical protein